MKAVREISARHAPPHAGYRLLTYHKPGSTIVRVVFESAPDSNYYIKIKHHQYAFNAEPQRTRDGLRKEYANLVLLHAAPNLPFSFPRPLHFDDEAMTLATSEVRGTHLPRRHPIPTRCLYRCGPQLQAALVSIGAACRALHALRLDLPPLQPAHYTLNLLNVLASPHMPLRGRLVDRLRAYSLVLDRHLLRVGDLSTCHGDLGLHNILLGPAGVGFVDFDSLISTRPEHDLAMLFVSLREFLLLVPRTRERLASLWSSFCEGYGKAVSVARMRPFLIPYTAHHLLDLSVMRRGAFGSPRFLLFLFLIVSNTRLLDRLLRTDSGWDQ